MLRRKEDNTPKYVVLCILFFVALHVKLQYMLGYRNTTYLLSASEGRSSSNENNIGKKGESKSAIAQDRSSEMKKYYLEKIKPLLKPKQQVLRDIFDAPDPTGTIPNISITATSCSKLFDRDEDEIERAMFHFENQTYVPIDDRSFIFPATRCQAFIKKRQYLMETMTEEEALFPIAFSILMFKDVKQTERLLRMIYRPQNYYCIHVDFKSKEETFQAMASIAQCFPNIILASKRSDVRWGQFSVLEPELTCLRDLSKWKWKYFINLTGQEMPLKTNYQLVKILSVYNGANDVEYLKRYNHDRMKYVHKNGKATKALKSPPPHNITLHKGAIHVTLSRGYCDFVLNDKRSLDFVEWLKDTGVPDEMFFSTMNRNVQFGIPGAYLGSDETSVKTNSYVSRFKNWGEHPCAGKKSKSICILSVGDIWLMKDRYDLFANKFYDDYHPLAYDCMEQRYFNTVKLELSGDRQFDTTFYEQLKFVQNHR